MANREEKSGVTWEDPNDWEAWQPQEDRVGEAVASTQSPMNTVIQEYMQTIAAQSVMQTGYDYKMVQRAIERLLMIEGIENLTGEKIVGAIFSIEEEEEEMNSLHASRGDEISANEIDGHETECGASGGEPSADKKSAQERLMREYQELRNATLCKICHNNIISVVFLPCGHLLTCVNCAPQVKACPICRSLVRATAKAYFN
ncbi:hypothetical protein CHS0354_015449 [Potamilus streckersoni]|uniref:RING-type domain-containing protein n=1 Tax=Potamilus streckersoni TaxID=2493646 RepID=A0AAE0VZ81_9BIVA|nr:hypothetical protein CHS0354_015449 [Potamilus streckersoni]